MVMKGIAATVGAEGRRDFFWLDSGYGMMASSPARGLGFNLRRGGIFTSPPVAVASMARRPRIFDLEAFSSDSEPETPSRVEDDAEREEAFAADDGPASAALTPERFGGLGGLGGLGGTGPLTQRIDLFGLGLDYAMYHKSFWGVHDEDSLSPWFRLGGIFVSAPAAIAWAGNRVDVFGLGTDHAMFTKTRTGSSWTSEWQRLGGAFTSAASLVSRGPNQLDIFARGADFTLRGNQTDGATWFGWQNHGGALASPPVAVSWGSDRIDVFAIFRDGALWHRWWDGQIWNEWESLGGNYAGEPAVASWGVGRLDVFVMGALDRKLHHHWFSGDTWSLPETMDLRTLAPMAESATVISAAPNRLELFVPIDDNLRQIRRGVWNGETWEFGSTGAAFKMPCRYRFSVDHIRVHTTRARNNDTDAAMAAVAAGNVKTRINTQWIGKIGGIESPKESQTNLLDFEPVTVDLAEPMSFSYLVVNNGHAPKDKILAALASAGDSLSLAGSSSMEEDIAKGVAQFVTIRIQAALTISIPVVGSIVGKIESWLLGKLTDAIFESCDGIVAVEMRAMLGRDLFMMTDNGRNTIQVTTRHPGTDSPFLCGAKSVYDVTWRIKPL
jgi:hypothetical protein